MTKCLFRLLVDQITEKVRSNKYVAGARVVNEQSGVIISETQVYNHMRSWRAKWTRIYRLRNLSGLTWDHLDRVIKMGREEYDTYIQITLNLTISSLI